MAARELPDPGGAGELDELVERLRSLKVAVGDPSYECIKVRVNAAWARAGRPATDLAGKTTIADCFRSGRRRLNTDLVVAVVEALHPDAGYITQWRQSLQVIGGQSRAAAQVRVQGRLPAEIPGFTGRDPELARLLGELGRTGSRVVVLTGMAGVGKTELAIHAGHMLAGREPFDRVLFVDLRGFHPDPAQPPADPGAVLDGFLRLLGVSGQQVPHGLAARSALYRSRVAGGRTLVVLDNAAGEDQVRPLLPATAGCSVLVTSRRRLTALRPATQLAVDVFTADEARSVLARTGVTTGRDPHAGPGSRSAAGICRSPSARTNSRMDRRIVTGGCHHIAWALPASGAAPRSGSAAASAASTRCGGAPGGAAAGMSGATAAVLVWGLRVRTTDAAGFHGDEAFWPRPSCPAGSRS